MVRKSAAARLNTFLTGNDSRLLELVEQHYIRIAADWLSRYASTVSEPRTADELRHAANILRREHAQDPGTRTLVVNDAQRQILAEAIGDAPQGDDARRLAAMLRLIEEG